MLPARSAAPIDILAIDTVFALYRSFLVTPPLTNSDGFPTGALHGGLGSILRIIEEVRPRHVVLALEGGGDEETARAAVSSDYKAQRNAFPQDFSRQFPVLLEIAHHLGWHCLSHKGQEADDIIASICTQYPHSSKVVFTTDKDILSLVDAHTRVYQRQKQKSILLEEPDIAAKWGNLPPSKILDVLSLAGDKVDNIKGVAGIGLKSALSLVRQFGSAPKVYENLDQVPKAQRTRLEAGKADFQLSYQLVQLNTTLPLPNLAQDPAAPDLAAVEQCASRYGLNSVLRRIQTLYSPHP